MKILVCMWYNEDIKVYADFFKKINEKYCNDNNYDFLYSDKKYTDKPPAFNKIYLLKELLEKNEYDYYVWIDADAHINKMDYPLEMFIDNGIYPQDYNFIWSGDLTPNINTGFFIVRNCDYSKQFIDLWIDTKKTTNKHWWEQGVFTKMWVDNDMDIRKFSHCYRYGILQHFKNKWDNLVYHMAGTSKNDRVKYANSLKY